MRPFNMLHLMSVSILAACVLSPNAWTVPTDRGFTGASGRALIVVLDISGSMHGEPLAKARDSLRQAMVKLPRPVKTGLVAMGGCDPSYVRTMVPLAANQHEAIVAAADQAATRAAQLNPGYAEDIYTALLQAEAEAKKLPRGSCVNVLILSDTEYTCANAHQAPDIVRRIVGNNGGNDGAAGGSEPRKNCSQVGVVSIGAPFWETEFLDEIAEAGRGVHVAASDSTGVEEAVNEVLEQFQSDERSANAGWSGDYSQTRPDGAGPGTPDRRTREETQPSDDGREALEAEQDQENERGGH